jgi:translation initiation factor 2 alpha subunit (eIF-2alpha)
MEYEEGDLVPGIVEKIRGTTIFVKLPQGKQGTLVFSEVSPGRIRNIRDYVFPGKQIVCKILNLSKDHISLSIRRVSKKEEQEIKKQIKLEKSFKAILRTVLEKDKATEMINKIQEETRVYDFLQESRENPKKLETIISKEKAEKILGIINSQKKKNSVVKKEFFLISIHSNGLTEIKEILGNLKDCEIRYLSAGKYLLKTEDKDLKNADRKAEEILENIKKKAKEKDLDYDFKEK